jgi:hypothetical protein
MKTPIAALTMTALLLVAGGCQVGGNSIANSHPSDGGEARFGVFGLNPFVGSAGSTQQNSSRPSGAFTATSSILAEDRTFTLSAAHQVFEITDSQAAPVLAAKAILGSVSFRYGTLSNQIVVTRSFNGQLGTSSNDLGNPANPDISINSGWAYIAMDSSYANGTNTGYRPIVRTKRVIAMSQGTSMLIFNDPATSEEFIINRANAVGNITVTLNNNPNPFIVQPGYFMRVSGTETSPTGETPKLISGEDSAGKLRSFMRHVARPRMILFPQDVGE